MRSFTLRLLLLVGLLAESAYAQDKGSAVELGNPLPAVVLTDGRTLHDLKIISYGSTSVLAKWEGGRGTIPYSVLPVEIRQAAENARAGQRKTLKPEESEPATALTKARRGFVTHLLRKESSRDTPELPPAGVLDLVTYAGPLGRMAAYVSPSPHDGKRHSAIIWLAGGWSNSISSLAWTPGTADNDQSAAAFREQGILMMYPSLRGGNLNPGSHEKFYGEVDDVIAAAKYLAQLDYVDPQRIYLGGHSTGGTLALLVAESTDRFRTVYSLGPVADMQGYGKETLPFDTSNPLEGQLRSPLLWLDSIRTKTFVLEGVEPPSNIARLRALAKVNHNPLVNFREVPGGTHFTIISPLVREIARQIRKDDGK